MKEICDLILPDLKTPHLCFRNEITPLHLLLIEMFRVSKYLPRLLNDLEVVFLDLKQGLLVEVIFD